MDISLNLSGSIWDDGSERGVEGEVREGEDCTHLKSMMNDDCCLLFGCHVVMFEGGRLFSYVAVIFVRGHSSLDVSSCFCSWALIFIHEHLILYMGTLSLFAVCWVSHCGRLALVVSR